MVELEFDKAFVKRYREFLDSKEFKSLPNGSKTGYWDYESSLIDINIVGNKVKLSGSSGFTIPLSSQTAPTQTTQRILRRIIRAAKNPKKSISFFKRIMTGAPDEGINLLNYYDAFDKVMDHDPVADPTLSPYRINFKKLKENKGSLGSVSEIRRNYFAGEKYSVTHFILLAYYWFNILNGFLDLKKVKKIVEIGAGSGNLMSILHNNLNDSTIIDVDLSESLSHSILFIKDLFPKATMLMPNEVNGKNFNDYNFVYLTPDQIGLIENDTVDLVINTCAFQEIAHKLTKIYFDLIQRSCAHGSYFFCVNRVEKIPTGKGPYIIEHQDLPNRFCDYPWNANNDILVYEICRLYRLVQLDSVFIRLETINKINN